MGINAPVARRLGADLEKSFLAGCIELRVSWAMERGLAPRETILKLRILQKKLEAGMKLDENEKLLVEYLAVAHSRENWLEDILKEW